jgi:hypothetical protein
LPMTIVYRVTRGCAYLPFLAVHRDTSVNRLLLDAPMHLLGSARPVNIAEQNDTVVVGDCVDCKLEFMKRAAVDDGINELTDSVIGLHR